MEKEKGVQRIEERLKEQALRDELRLTVHAHQKLVAEDVSLEELRHALCACRRLEDYPLHQRGPCCLVCGQDPAGRFLHIVCTTSLEVAIIITVYEPKPPKWPTPFERRKTT